YHGLRTPLSKYVQRSASLRQCHFPRLDDAGTAFTSFALMGFGFVGRYLSMNAVLSVKNFKAACGVPTPLEKPCGSLGCRIASTVVFAALSSGMMMSVLILLILDTLPYAMKTGQAILLILSRVNFWSSGV